MMQYFTEAIATHTHTQTPASLRAHTTHTQTPASLRAHATHTDSSELRTHATHTQCPVSPRTHHLEEVEWGDCAESKLQLLHDEELHPLDVGLTAGTAVAPHQGLQQRGDSLRRGRGKNGMGSLTSGTFLH